MLTCGLQEFGPGALIPNVAMLLGARRLTQIGTVRLVKAEDGSYKAIRLDKPNGGAWSVPTSTTDKFPSSWGAGKPNRKDVGTRWTDPNNPGNGVRIDQGNPSNPQVSQQVDHVIVRVNGKVIGRDGKPINGSIADNAEQAHIPLSEYQNWSNWNSP